MVEQLSEECRKVVQRYARRKQNGNNYSMLNADVWQRQQELERALIAGVRTRAVDVGTCRLLDVGCGSGGNLLEMIRFGFEPYHLAGVELLDERIAMARNTLPTGVQLVAGDAVAADFQSASFDIVYQSTVFSSLLDNNFQQQLADAMWSWLRPGGYILWYDFIFDNPHNPDVRGVKPSRIRELFPHGKVESKRITLAPPLARRLCHIHPSLYTLFNILPFLRTHVLCWIQKPE